MVARKSINHTKVKAFEIFSVISFSLFANKQKKIYRSTEFQSIFASFLYADWFYSMEYCKIEQNRNNKFWCDEGCHGLFRKLWFPWINFIFKFVISFQFSTLYRKLIVVLISILIKILSFFLSLIPFEMFFIANERIS